MLSHAEPLDLSPRFPSLHNIHHSGANDSTYHVTTELIPTRQHLNYNTNEGMESSGTTLRPSNLKLRPNFHHPRHIGARRASIA
jgi:hypothetical protein